MRIVSLDPLISVTLVEWELELSGASRECLRREELSGEEIRIIAESEVGPEGSAGQLEYRLMPGKWVDLKALAELQPDMVLTAHPGLDNDAALRELQEELRAVTGVEDLRLHSFAPQSLDSLYEFFRDLGRVCGLPEKGIQRSSLIKAQFMDWADNFYDRTKSKKVTFLVGLDPFLLGGLWIPEMIRLASAVSQASGVGLPPRETSWNDIVAFNPEVIILALREESLESAIARLPELQRLAGWDDVLAVKRSQVFFCDGQRYFNQPFVNIIGSMSILISAMAGLESGYITERDSFYGLRWIELQRHRFFPKK